MANKPVYKSKKSKSSKYVKKNYRKKVYKKKVPVTHMFRRLGTPIDLKLVSGSLTTTGDASTQLNTSASGLSSTYDLALGMNFKLANVTTASDFQQLFDRYCIKGVSLKIMFDCNYANVQGAGILPYITYSPDYDDSVLPASEAALQQKQYAKSTILSGSKIIKTYIRPRPAIATTSALGITGAMIAPKNVYINCDQATTAHNAFKAWITNIYNPAGAQVNVRIQPTYYLAMKDSQ